MQRQLKVLFVAIAVLFLLLEGACLYWQVWRAPKLALDLRNPRYLYLTWNVPRGGIYTFDGETIAESVEKPNQGRKYERRYWAGSEFGPILGYVHPRFGEAGLEKAYSEILMGRSSPWRRFTGGVQPGSSIILTIDSRVQKAAEKALAGHRGAVVVLQPHTGRILAVASGPGFDPNRLDEDFAELRNRKDSPLFDRAFQGLYPPGSAFKIVVLAGAFRKGVTSLSEVFEDKGYVTVEGRRIENFEGKEYGEINPLEALAVSSNPFFSSLGLRLGASGLDSLAREFFFDRTFLSGLSLSGRWGGLSGCSTAIAEMSIGQGDFLVTPLHMALATAIIANEGTAVEPYLLAGTKSPGGSLRRFRTEKLGQVVSAQAARIVRDAMVQVVVRGTGQAAQVPGITLAGKTGTAENPLGKAHAWFVGFAPADNPEVAFAVVVENGGSGGGVAAPIAARLIRNVFHR